MRTAARPGAVKRDGWPEESDQEPETMLPFPEMPYGPAPAWCFPLMELSVFVLTALCARDAWKRGAGAMAYLAGGFVFGVSLETMEVMGGSYTYGHFMVMLWRDPKAVPLFVGCAWAIILYATRLLSDGLGLGMWSAASLDALAALSADISMDVVAYRLHMWHWDWKGSGLDPLKAQWFGIPYGNFVGWITVVFGYSLFSRMAERRLARGQAGVLRWTGVAALGYLGAMALLFGTESFVFPAMNAVGFKSGLRMLTLMVGLAAVVWMNWRKREAAAEKAPAVAHWVLGWFHVLFTALFFGLGLWRENAAMTAVAVANAAAGFAMHRWVLDAPEKTKTAEMEWVEEAA